MTMKYACCTVGMLLMLLTMMTWPTVNGHGRLREPPSRSSMWRSGFNTPKNYDDTALNCGGMNTQWYVNGGKCGVCGDPWDQPQPRENEAGGRYGNGIITRHYTPGQTVDVRIDITANHRGWFEFRLCAHNSPSTPITHQCLDQHLLELADGSGTEYTLSPSARFVEVKLKLPPGLTCTQCVLQWKWHCGNNAGNIQEEFYGCSDIAIGTSQSASTASTIRPTNRPSTSSTTLARAPTTTTSGGSNMGPCRGINAWQGVAELDLYCNEQCPKGNCPPQYCSCSGPIVGQPSTAPPTAPPTAHPTSTPGGHAGPCHGINAWQGVPELDLYCNEQCPKGNCPSEFCSCSGPIAGHPTTAPPTALPTAPPTSTPTPTPGSQTGPCHGINAWQGNPDLDLYCNEQCPRGNCPSEFCSCSGPIHGQSTTISPPATTAPDQTTISVSCRAIGQWQGSAMLDMWCRENCAQGLCPAHTCKCDVTTAPHTTPHAPTTGMPVQSSQPSSGQCHGINDWHGVPELDLYCREQCPLGNCPATHCSCSGAVLVPYTGLPPQHTSTASPAPSSTGAGQQKCRAVGTWAGQPDLDNWCSQTCPQYGCDQQFCHCDPVTAGSAHQATSSAPTQSNSNSCYAIKSWAGNALLDKYCNEECRTGLCPSQYCACGPGVAVQATPSLVTATPSLVTATPGPVTPMSPQSRQCWAINTWQGVAELDLWCRTECAIGNCPPDYCHCDP